MPNVGKSSLLNLLAEEDKAIVTEIPGTTRDLVEANFFIEGIKINAVDTAGLRESKDPVEKIGIERSYLAQKDADGVFFIFDAAKGLSADEIKELEGLDPAKTHLIGNKRDQIKATSKDLEKSLLGALKTSKFLQKIGDFETYLKEKVLFVSALDKTDRLKIHRTLKRRLALEKFEDLAVISQARHFDNLSKALENMGRAKMLLKTKASSEFIALELKESLIAVQETLGKRFDDQIMDRVFKEFCLGK